MKRYCINADVSVDAWAYLEADSMADALDAADELRPADFQLGDPVHVTVISAEVDDS